MTSIIDTTSAIGNYSHAAWWMYLQLGFTAVERVVWLLAAVLIILVCIRILRKK